VSYYKRKNTRLQGDIHFRFLGASDVVPLYNTWLILSIFRNL